MNLDLAERAEEVQTRGDLVRFIAELEADLRTAPEGWENADLPSFLQAIAAFVNDIEGFYANKGESLESVSPWRFLADVLMAARVYE